MESAFGSEVQASDLPCQNCNRNKISSDSDSRYEEEGKIRKSMFSETEIDHRGEMLGAKAECPTKKRDTRSANLWQIRVLREEFALKCDSGNASTGMFWSLRDSNP